MTLTDCSRTHSPLLAGFAFFFFLPLLACVSEAQQLDIKQGAESFVNLIQKRDVEALLDRFSEQGTSFVGTAYVPTKTTLALSETSADFRHKTGAYCLFFDTNCFRSEDASARAKENGRPLTIPLISVVELLAKATQIRFETYSITAQNGKVTVLLSPRTSETARLGEDAVNFYFRLEKGQWKLRNMEYN